MRRRRFPSREDLLGRTSVFVPGALASGLIVSAFVLLSDAVRRLRGSAFGHRRTRATAEAIAEQTASAATGCPPDLSAVLRPRGLYIGLAVPLLALAGYGLAGGYWNYWNASDAFHAIGWLWAVTWLAAIGLGCVGAAAAVVALTYPSPPAWVVPLLLRSPLTRTPRMQQRPTARR